MTAIYNPPPTLNRRTATSFYASDVFSLAQHLITNDFTAEPPSKPDARIFCRFWRSGALVTIFNSGAVLVQGDDTAAGVDFCAGLCAAGEVF